MSSNRLVWLLSLVFVASQLLPICVAHQPVPIEVRERLDREFASAHPQPNDFLPDLLLTDQYNKQSQLRHASDADLVVVVTASFTCPKTRQHWTGLQELKKKYGKRLGVVVIYVVEAHPENDICPYLGYVDVTDANIRDNILYPQPRTWDDRVGIAQKFSKQFKVPGKLFIDSMDNAAWRALGKSPNMALLVDRSQRVIIRQGWFDPKELDGKINEWMASHPIDVSGSDHRLAVVDRSNEEDGGMGPKTLTAEGQSKQKSKSEKDLDEVLSKLDPKHRSEWNLVRWLESVTESKLQKFCDRYPSLVNTILTHGAHDRYRSSILQLIVAQGEVSKVRILLNAGADVNLKVEDTIALSTAIKAGHSDVVQLLLEAKGDATALVGREKQSLLHFALLHGQLPIARQLEQAGAQPDFFCHCGQGSLALIRLTLQKDPSRGLSFDAAGNTPLTYAVRCNQPEVVQLLLENDSAYANPWSRSDSPVKLAVGLKKTDILEMLLDAGLSPDIDRPVFEAIGLQSAAHLELLLKAKPNLTTTEKGMSALHHAVSQEGALELAKLLIAYGADVNATTVKYSVDGCGPTDTIQAGKETPLHVASRSLKADCVSLLIENGAKLEELDAANKTPLGTAILHTFLTSFRLANDEPPSDAGYKTIKALVAGGCNPRCMDSEGNVIIDSLFDLQKNPGTGPVPEAERFLLPSYTSRTDHGYGPYRLDSKLLFGKKDIVRVLQELQTPRP